MLFAATVRVKGGGRSEEGFFWVCFVLSLFYIQARVHLEGKEEGSLKMSDQRRQRDELLDSG